MSNKDETKNLILAAAENRFRQYGFNKTTMAEIASDCSMSAANIYRFFESKKDIIADLVTELFRQTEDGLRLIVRKKGVSAGEKLKKFILEMLHQTKVCCGTDPRINEAVDFIARERFDLVDRHKEVKQSLIAEILAEGNIRGEFEVEDIVETAEMILKATILFHYPTFLNVIPMEDMQRYAYGIAHLLINGLGKEKISN